MMNVCRRALLLTASVLSFSSATAHADSAQDMAAMKAQMEALARQVQALTQMVEGQGRLIAEQKAALAAQEEKVSAVSAPALQPSVSVHPAPAMPSPATAAALAAVDPAAGDAPDGVKISMAPGPKIESADGKYSMQIFGRAHMDYTHFDDDVKDHPNNANLRRARLGVKGNLGEDFAYKAEMDFAREAVNFKEVYLSYAGLDPAEFYIGHFKPPQGLERNTSGNYIQTIERAPVTAAFTRDEMLGVKGAAGGDNWSFIAGAFNEDAGNSGTGGDEAASAEARATMDLLPGADVLHAGLSGSYRVPNNGTDSETLAAKVTGIGDNLVSTGAIANVDHSTVYGAELAGVFGPLSLQGEYLRFDVARDTGGDPSFGGWYAQAGYFLTGETRPYKAKTGSFDRVKPLRPLDPAAGNWGALELVGRYDTLDLNDGAITGGELSSWTAGANWHLTDYVRLMGNLVMVDTDGNAVVPDDDPNIVNLRAQWDF